MGKSRKEFAHRIVLSLFAHNTGRKRTGLCESVNDAIQNTAASGLVRNVSIMVPGPAFAQIFASDSM